MSCSNPIRVWRSMNKSETGKFPVSFRLTDAWHNTQMCLPCGRCLGCLKDRSMSWGIRCVHESQLHDENSFLTLTYHPKHLPRDGMLDKTHFQLFMKRLRKRIGVPVRYLMCGEYGAKTLRAHYHALLFGYEFPDCVFEKEGKNGDRIYHSDLLEEIWGFGKCVIGNVTMASAQYVAKYINKSQSLNPLLELPEFVVPYNNSSRRPGLGIPWLEKYWKDIYPRDYVVVDGGKYKPPRAYDKWLEVNFPDVFHVVKRKRQRTAVEYSLEHGVDEVDRRGIASQKKSEFWVDARDSI
jgi:hypothetical protein